MGTRRCRALWGFGSRGGCSGRRSASRLALIELTGRYDACAEAYCVGDIDAGQRLLIDPTPHSAAIETSAITTGA